MAKVIQAKAVLSAEDRGASAVFDKLSKKIDQVGRAGKAAVAVDQMAKSIERAKTQMVAIDKFNASRGSFVDARARFQATQAAVTQAAAAMKRGEGDARQLARSYERAQSAVASAARAFEMQKSAVIANKRALETMGVPVSQAARHQERLRAEIDRTTAAIRRQEIASEKSHNRRVAIAGAAAYAGHMVAHGVREGARATLHTYREFDKERRYGKAVMGLTDEQQQPLIDQAIHMGATTKFNDIQVLKSQRDLAARSLKIDQVMGVIEPAANLGQALDLDLPTASKLLEGSLFSFKRNLSTRASAVAAARKTADMQVAASKASGMSPSDLELLYKFGATPSRLVGLSEANLLAFGGIAKKANIGGDESGVAFRQLVASLVRPTRVAKEAILANGLNFKNYQRMPRQMEVDPFAENVAAQYGVKLNKQAKAGLGRIFQDQELINDPAKFAPAVLNVLGKTLGGNDAKSKKSIAGAANRYRDASVSTIDINALMRDLLTKIPGNLQLANAVFGPKQGGRIATALGDPETLKHILDIVDNKSEGRAEEIAKERMAGFDGAASRLEGASKNLQTAIGRGLDNNGKGGLLTSITDWMARTTQWMAERDPKVVAGGAVTAGAIGVGGSFYAGYKLLNILTTGGGLTASAVALDGSAAALTAAAGRLGLGGGLPGLPGGKGAPAAPKGPSILKKAMWAGGILGVPALIGVGTYYAAESANEAQGITRDSERERRKKQAAKYNRWGKYDPAGADARLAILAAEKPSFIVPELTPSMTDELPASSGFPNIRVRRRKHKGHSNAPLIYRTSTGFPSPELSPSMTYGTDLGRDPGPLNATLTGTAEVHGEATVNLKIEGEQNLIRVVAEQAAKIAMRGVLTSSNDPGSSGKSSPDASAPPTGASGAW